jgi:hypothetical protein
VDLASKTSVPSRRDVPALKGVELHNLSHQLPNWEVVNEHHICRSFKFPGSTRSNRQRASARSGLGCVERSGIGAKDGLSLESVHSTNCNG